MKLVSRHLWMREVLFIPFLLAAIFCVIFG